MMNVFDIQHSSYHDGPGIRTVVFLKGCNLKCFWCQNPESQNRKRELMYYPKLCIGCRRCEKVCLEECHEFRKEEHIFLRNKCIRCGSCSENCYAGALVMTGRMMEEEDVLVEVLRDEELFKISGGGVTLSGGEPLLQPDACGKLLERVKEEGINTLIETAGNVPWENFENILTCTDRFFYDIKLLDRQKHESCCGVSNERILENLIRLSERTAYVSVRMPVIPGVNDNTEEIRALAEFVTEKTKVRDIKLIPFHRLGKGKYEALGRKYQAAYMKSPSEEKMEELRNMIKIKMSTYIADRIGGT